jgi:antagonist of KipI
VKLVVLRKGFLTTVQDLGRVGWRQFGVSAGGALDINALRAANLLVGNEEGAAGIEMTFGGLHLRFNDERIVAWCGGEFDVRLGSTQFSAGHAAFLTKGDELTFNQPKTGCRCWLAISGGIDVPVVLGSRSTDLRANFGGHDGRALVDGDELPLGSSRQRAAATDEKISSWSASAEWTQTARRQPILRVSRGKHWSCFNNSVHFALTTMDFEVTVDSNRMGVRLEGPEMKRNDEADLISEAVAPGTIQVPPSGKPIVLLGDCQTIGGYPKIAHVITVDLPIAAQLRPGDRVRFREVSLADAHRLLFERERDFELFRTGLTLRV